MPHDLTEFQEIVNGEWAGGHISGRRPSSDELTRALQVLLTRQCVYSHTPGIGRTYEIVKTYAPFFEAYFGALGHRLIVSQRDQMVALSVPRESRYDTVYQRLSKTETIVLLALRLMWEEAVASQDIGEGGIAESTTGDLIDRIKSVTQSEPPEEAKLAEILRLFQRHGAVRVGERDRVERVSPLSILPGVSVLVPDNYLEELKLWAAAPDTQSAADADDLPDIDLSGFTNEA